MRSPPIPNLPPKGRPRWVDDMACSFNLAHLFHQTPHLGAGSRLQGCFLPPCGLGGLPPGRCRASKRGNVAVAFGGDLVVAQHMRPVIDSVHVFENLQRTRPFQREGARTANSATSPSPEATASAFSWICLFIGTATASYGLFRLVTVQWPRGMPGDLNFYYQAARALLANQPVYPPLTDIDQTNGFIYPPLSLVFFLPIACLAPPTASLLFTLVSYGAMWGSTSLFLRRLTEDRGQKIDGPMVWASHLLTLGLGPTYMTLACGQVNSIVLLLCVIFWIFLRRRPHLAGAALALACWIKVYPVALFLAALMDLRSWRALKAAAFLGLILPLSLLWLIPLDLYAEYAVSIMPRVFRVGTTHVINQSIWAAAARLEIPLAKVDAWHFFQLGLGGSYAQKGLLAVMSIAVALWLRKNFEVRSLTAFALQVALVPVLITLGWGHTFVLAMPLLLLLLVTAPAQTRLWRFGVLLILLGLAWPSYSHVKLLDRGPSLLGHVFYSRYALAVIAAAVLALRLPECRSRRDG